MNKLAYELGQRFALAQATGDTEMIKAAATRAAEIMLGPLAAGLNTTPEDTFGKAWVRQALMGAGGALGGMGGALGSAGIAHLLGGAEKAKVLSAILGGVGGLGLGAWGGRALGEHVTDYDPERGY